MVQLAEVNMCQAASIADGDLTEERHIVHAPQDAAVRGPDFYQASAQARRC